MKLLRLLLPAAAVLVISASAESSLSAVTVNEIGQSECAMHSTLEESSSLDAEGGEESAQWRRHRQHRHKHRKHHKCHKHSGHHRHHKHHDPECVVEVTTEVMVCPTDVPTVAPTVAPTMASVTTHSSVPSTSVKPTVEPTGQPMTTTPTPPRTTPASTTRAATSVATTAAPPVTTAVPPVTSTTVSSSSERPTVQPTGSPLTTTSSSSRTSTTVVAPVTSTEAPPAITTTEAPPGVTTTEAPPAITTTEAPPGVTTTEAPPAITTTEAPPGVITTEAPSVTTTTANPSPTGVSDGLTEEQRSILSTHNELRARHGVPPVTWSKAAEDFGAHWIEPLCMLQHSGGPYGENLAMGQTTWTDAIQDWYSEIKDYDFNNPGYTPETGHFTQVVWKSSTAIGCAKKDCSGTPLYICEYDPAGNIDSPEFFRANVLPLI